MKSLALGAVIAVLVLGLATQGQADNLTLSLSNGGAPQTCADGAVCDSNPLAGAVTFTTTFGTITVALGGTGSGTPALSPLNLDLSYNLTAGTGTGPATYRIMVSENNLSATSVAWSAQVGGTQTNGATTSFAAFADTNNALFTNNTGLCAAGPTGASPFSLTCSSGTLTDNLFSLTDQITLVANAGQTSASGDAALLAAVPEPGTLFLLGSALAAMGAAVRWRRGRPAA